MTETKESETLHAVQSAQEALAKARMSVYIATEKRDAAIAAAVAAGDAVVDVAHAARMNTSNVGRRVAAVAAAQAQLSAV